MSCAGRLWAALIHKGNVLFWEKQHDKIIKEFRIRELYIAVYRIKIERG